MPSKVCGLSKGTEVKKARMCARKPHAAHDSRTRMRREQGRGAVGGDNWSWIRVNYFLHLFNNLWRGELGLNLDMVPGFVEYIVWVT